MIKAIFFDQDNTIFNTNKIAKDCYKSSFQFLSNKTGITQEIIYSTWKNFVNTVKDSQNPNKRFFSSSLTSTIKSLNINLSLKEEALNRFYSCLKDKIELTPGTKTFLKQNKLLKILFTEDNKYQNRLKLSKFKLTEYFDLIITSDNTNTMKPNIRYLQIGWDNLKLKPEECIYIGDNWEKDCKLGVENGGFGVLFGQTDSNETYQISEMTELSSIINDINQKSTIKTN